MSLTLIQCASGRYVDLLAHTSPHHAHYCQKHGYNYLLHIGRVQHLYHPMWDKIKLVQHALQLSDLVVWMDTDSIIVNRDEELTKAFGEFQNIGVCRHEVPGLCGHRWHYNCGVMFFRNTTATREFLCKVWNTGVVPHEHWKVQATMLAVNEEMDVMSRINDKWNSTVGTNVSPAPVIESWHGHNQDFAPILNRLTEVMAP